MDIIFFRNTDELRKWFQKNHLKEKELLAGYYKKSTGRESITWPESVDAALCFGWIDGIRKSIDDESYVIRFTPRNPKSSWSAINIRKVEELKKLGLMTPAGLEAYKYKTDKNSKVYSFEQGKIEFDEKYLKIFKKNKKAFTFFNNQVPSYKKPAIHWILSAKKEETKLKRLEILINNSENGEKIPPLRRNIK